MDDGLDLEHLILVSLLGRRDAAFIPDRNAMSWPRHTVIYERRRARAVPWSSEVIIPGLDDTGRKQVQRALEGVAARSWAITAKPHAAKTLAVRLTDVGDEYARQLVGLPGAEAAIGMMDEIRRRLEGPEVCHHLGRVWVPETMLAGVRWGDNLNRKAFVAVEENLLPALVRGWLVSNCSVRGHCWYTIGPVKPEPVAAIADPPDPSQYARGEYYYQIQTEMERLAEARPECDREIGEIPMPVAGT